MISAKMIITRNIVEECRRLPIYFLKQSGLLKRSAKSVVSWKGISGVEKIEIFVRRSVGMTTVWLAYSINDPRSHKRRVINYAINLTSTECNYGGSRYWFVCPLTSNGVPCQRRVGVLYLPPNGSFFGCRHCYDLTYEARNENRRYKYHEYLEFIRFEEKIKRLKKTTKRSFYAGKPTRSQKQLMKLHARVGHFSRLINQQNLVQ